MKRIKMTLGIVASVILGFIFMGGLDLDDITFRRNIMRLKREEWFKKIIKSGYHYNEIYDNPKVREYLLQENIVSKIKNNEKEREYFQLMISKNTPK
ncbi:hypothetical protein [Jeotgalibacillus aurantiacus]|uniref:hypothetical protein n=1 Tax=Jeotgalibacillus aurantiacus TaxID=2763266 RepID=UPI001D0BDDF4|nr:hypothetical protein [Jeotgalibacillus aurantiacus]